MFYIVCYILERYNYKKHIWKEVYVLFLLAKKEVMIMALKWRLSNWEIGEELRCEKICNKHSICALCFREHLKIEICFSEKHKKLVGGEVQPKYICIILIKLNILSPITLVTWQITCEFWILSWFIWIFILITTVITNLQLHFWLFWTSSVPHLSYFSFCFSF
jgi:hypothetical protein